MRPDLEFICTYSFPVIFPPCPQRWQLTPEPEKKYISISFCLNHPLSRGTIHAKSKDPLDQPEIDPHYFEHDFGSTYLPFSVDVLISSPMQTSKSWFSSSNISEALMSNHGSHISIEKSTPLRKFRLMMTSEVIFPLAEVIHTHFWLDYIKDTIGTVWRT